jgi:molybdenum cofactor guanylyltransferase
MNPALYGLVLAGGRSTRMQRDKAALAYHGRSQLEIAFEHLSAVVERAFVSVRPDQTEDPLRRAFPQIVDRLSGHGPVAGILAALETHPDRAWLIVACDLPFLDSETLAYLVQQRDSSRVATAFRSAHDGLPEPLCAIWEGSARRPLQAWADAGRSCPRKFLLQSAPRLCDLPARQALDNVNSAPEYWAAMSTLHPDRAAPPLEIRVQYFALLREQAGRSEERIHTHARSAADLYEELRARHAFTLAPASLRVAVNAEFGDWQQPLAQGDTVVFIPPVAGG